MLQYSDANNIAFDILADLGISEEACKNWSKEEIDALNDRYLNNEDYIRGLIIDKLREYDTSDNVPVEIRNVTENAISEIFFRIDDIVNKYYENLNDFTISVYNEIVQSMNNIIGVENVEPHFEKADSRYDIEEERSIEVTLSNGASIYFEVKISEI